MIIPMILFTIAIGIAVWCITMSITDSNVYLLFLSGSLIFTIGGIGVIDSTPMNKDVREGEAHYVEQNHIEVLNGDTINTYKTYQIEWIENSK